MWEPPLAAWDAERDRRAGWRTRWKDGAPGRRIHQTYEGPWRDLVHHSGRVLQALTFQPTGAIVAAPTTSLPETVGGERNWDYRYTWVRDASLTMEALWVAACPDEANKFFAFLADAAASQLQRGTDLQIMFGDRRRARPFRAGAAAPGGLAGQPAGAGRQRRVEPAPARRVRRTARRGRSGWSSSSVSSTRSPSSSWPPPRTPPPAAGRRRTRASGRSAASHGTSCTPS